MKIPKTFKKYPNSWLFFFAALVCGAGWVSGRAGLAVIGLIGFLAIRAILGKVGAQDPE